MTKEEKIDLVEKWSPFMDGLSKSFGKRYKYSRIYENTILNNNKKDYNFLLSLLYQVFKKSDSIKLSSRKNNLNHEVVHSYENIDLYENNKIVPLTFRSYVSAISTEIKNKLDETIPKISYIKVERSKTLNIITIYY